MEVELQRSEWSDWVAISIYVKSYQWGHIENCIFILIREANHWLLCLDAVAAIWECKVCHYSKLVNFQHNLALNKKYYESYKQLSSSLHLGVLLAWFCLHFFACCTSQEKNLRDSSISMDFFFLDSVRTPATKSDIFGECLLLLCSTN